MYQIHSINFYQQMESFFGTVCMPQILSNIPYFVVVCQGHRKDANDLVGAKVRRSHVYNLFTYLLWHIPHHQHLL